MRFGTSPRRGAPPPSHWPAAAQAHRRDCSPADDLLLRCPPALSVSLPPERKGKATMTPRSVHPPALQAELTAAAVSSLRWRGRPRNTESWAAPASSSSRRCVSVGGVRQHLPRGGLEIPGTRAVAPSARARQGAGSPPPTAKLRRR
jgi:hypothetical protein